MPTMDKFANRFCVQATEAIAGTIKFFEVPTYVDAFSHKAFLMHRLEYLVSITDTAALVGAGDMIACALCSANNITSIIGSINYLAEPGLIDLMQLQFELRGAAASFQMREAPIMHDFTQLPGGGILVPARGLYVAIQGASLAAACQCVVRGWFTQVELKADEYLELVDAYRIIR